jgi:asparagine synthase (glutamine-hydrolysing)
MGDAIAHRGPDAEGFWSDPGIGLAHRRLSIIDLAGGDQPMTNEDGTVVVVFNGEIYNYQALRPELESRGHRFRTHSDTEVLVHLYEEHGPSLVSHLRGMFAFALWDCRRRQLLLARDRLGIKPLYVYRDAEKLVFASEPKGLLAHPDIVPEVDPAALEDYLAFGAVMGPRSIFRRVEKLQPAHTLVATSQTLTAAPCRYWQLRFDPDGSRTVDDWEEAVLDKFVETVRTHLIADVPVGAFLSGGIDSGAVVAAAAGHVKGPLQTCTIGFHEAAFSEADAAREVAVLHGTRHVEETVTPDAVDLLGRLTHYFDEPFADASALPTFLVSRLAARHVKVALSGDGGDEAFGGYSRYAHDLGEDRVRRRLPCWVRQAILGPLAQVWPKADWLPRRLRAKTFLTNMTLDPADAYANTISQCRPPWRRRLLAPDVAAGLGGYDPTRSVRNGFGGGQDNDILSGMIAADVATLLPDVFLVKVDRASMACGLEVRPPLLDHELLELAAKIPSRWKVHGGETKWVLKRAVRRLLPSGALERPKQGFEVPVDAWLRGPLRGQFQDVVLHPRARVAALIDQGQANRLFRAHAAGVGRHGQVLWTLLVLAHWAERYLAASTIGPSATIPGGDSSSRRLVRAVNLN